MLPHISTFRDLLARILVHASQRCDVYLWLSIGHIGMQHQSLPLNYTMKWRHDYIRTYPDFVQLVDTGAKHWLAEDRNFTLADGFIKVAGSMTCIKRQMRWIALDPRRSFVCSNELAVFNKSSGS